MTYYLFITGCQYNYYDAKHLAHLMQKMGYVYVDEEKKADVIIVLACSVRQKPLDRIYGKIKVWKSLPQKPKIIITGCVLASDKKKLADKIDAIIKTGHLKTKLPKILSFCHSEAKAEESRRSRKMRSARSFTDVQDDKSSRDFYPADVGKDTALVPIMQGCNNFCTYCAVPYVRGQEKSRSTEEIIAEIKSELKKGKKHILLLGQNVNSYNSIPCHSRLGKPALSLSKGEMLRDRESTIKLDSHFHENDNFVTLLKKIDSIPAKFTFNFLSANPRNFSSELIELLPKLKKWQHVLHLPLQSGDDEILKKMNRKYTSSQYLKIITEVCRLISDVSFIADLMVGFPGETKKQFQNTVDLCKKIGFSKAYVNQYSPRPGTFAAINLADDVSQEEKKRRWGVLNDLINKKSKNKKG